MADAPGGPPEIILIASGSEVSLIVEAARGAAGQGRPLARRLDAVLGHLRAPAAGLSRGGAAARVKTRLAVEQASALGWERYVGDQGRVIGMKAFGASAPLKELQRKFGFEPEKVVAAALECSGASEIGRRKQKPCSDIHQSKDVREAETAAVAPPCAMVIFGAGGDLTKRLVTPALYNLVTAKRLPDGSGWSASTAATDRGGLAQEPHRHDERVRRQGGGEFQADASTRRPGAG
jgi:hypothetical protein